MALSKHFWSTTVKLALPLLVVMAIAAAPTFSGAEQLEHDDLLELGEGAALGKEGRGRFLSNFDEAIPTGRRHLNTLLPFPLCNPGPPDECKQRLGNDFTCCRDLLGINKCIFTASKCGSCNGPLCIGFGLKCCNGVCTNTWSDPKNCGGCGIPCRPGACIKGFCNYNGKP